MATRTTATTLPPVTYRRIVHATDFSALSTVALAHAVTLARTYQAELHLLHVVDESAYYWTAAGPEAMPLGPLPPDLEKTARQHLERFAAAHLPSGVPCVTQVLVGRPFVEIVRYAAAKECDLIVLGTHGRGALAHALMGSTAERVVRKASCPVLTVRDPEHTFAMP